jgi:hypothetical protein
MINNIGGPSQGPTWAMAPPTKLQSSYYPSVCCSPYENKARLVSRVGGRTRDTGERGRAVPFLVRIEQLSPVSHILNPPFSPGLDGGTEALVEAGGGCPVEFVSFALGAPFGRRRRPAVSSSRGGTRASSAS